VAAAGDLLILQSRLGKPSMKYKVFSISDKEIATFLGRKFASRFFSVRSLEGELPVRY
jgi:hypothetical protein